MNDNKEKKLVYSAKAYNSIFQSYQRVKAREKILKEKIKQLKQQVKEIWDFLKLTK